MFAKLSFGHRRSFKPDVGIFFMDLQMQGYYGRCLSIGTHLFQSQCDFDITTLLSIKALVFNPSVYQESRHVSRAEPKRRECCLIFLFIS